jgi:hypothetical protein
MNYAIEFNKTARKSYIDQIDKLLAFALEVIKTRKQDHYLFHATVNKGLFAQWRSASLSLLEDIFGQDGSIYKEFDKQTSHGQFEYEVTQGHGTLVAAKFKLESDLPVNLKQLLFYLQNIPSEKRPVGFQVGENN